MIPNSSCQTKSSRIFFGADSDLKCDDVTAILITDWLEIPGDWHVQSNTSSKLPRGSNKVNHEGGEGSKWDYALQRAKEDSTAKGQ